MKKTKAPPAQINPYEAAQRLLQPSCSDDTLTFSCELVTPMYGGGVKTGVVDEAMPFRATAIRGQLRFWWRLLHRLDAKGKVRPLAELFKDERGVWGGLGDAMSLARSKVAVRVLSKGLQPALKAAAIYPEGKSFPQWDNPAKAYALFPAANISDKQSAKQAAKLLPAGASFELQIKRLPGLDDTAWAGVRRASCWWAVFGGVGARTRRGVGSLAVELDGSPVLPPAEAEIKAAGCRLVIGKGEGSNEPQAAWKKAIGKLREFRQGPGVGRNPGKDKNRPGRSRWPEADTIRVLRGHAPQHPPQAQACGLFPRAMFGLPLITHFKDSGDPKDTSLQPKPANAKKAADRMASPLIVRALRTGANQWAPAVLLLPREHIERMGLVLLEGGSVIRTYAAGEWWQPVKASLIPPMASLADDPLDAFLIGFNQAQWPQPSSPKSLKPESVDQLFHKPQIRRTSNGSIEVMPQKDGKCITLIGDDARRFLAALSPHARKRLEERKLFNRLDLILRGSAFIRLTELSE